MKKFLLLFALFFAGAITLNASQLLENAPFAQWVTAKGAKAKLDSQKALCVGREFMLSPVKVPVKLGDCFTVNILYRKTDPANSSITLQIGFAEYDKNNKLLRRTLGFYTNPNRDEDHFATVREVCDARTAYIRFCTNTIRGKGIRISRMEIRKLDEEEKKIYSFSENQRYFLRQIQHEENLALGKACEYFPAPNRPCSLKDPNDKYDLTDGKFAHPYDESVDFYKGAVGFVTNRKNIRILLDLGKVQPLKKALIRVYGGRIANNIPYFPPVLEAYVSKDKNNFFCASRLTKLKITEKDDADNKTLYYLPEIASRAFPPQYMHTFELDLNADARYVLIRAPQSVYLIADELAVLKAQEKNSSWNSVYKKRAEKIHHNTLNIAIEYESVRLAENFFMPVWFRYDDRRTVKKGKFSMKIDIPSSVEFRPDNETYPAPMRTFSHAEKKGARTILHFKSTYNENLFYRVATSYKSLFGPFYFKGNKDLPEKERYMVITSCIDGKEVSSNKVPIRQWFVPKAPPMKHHRIMLYGNRSAVLWPGVFDFLKHINSPWITIDEQYRPNREEKVAAKIKAGGVKTILALYSCGILKARANREKRTREVMCVGDNATDSLSIGHIICPSYRGKYYQDMLKKVGDLVRRSDPDYVIMDEEAFMLDIGSRVMKCARCQALRKKVNLPWKDFFNYVQADYLSGMVKVIRANLKKKDAVVTCYAVSFQRTIGTPVGRVYFNGTNYLFPKWIDKLAPSNYSINTLAVQQQTRNDFKIVKDPRKLTRYIAMGCGAYGADDYGKTGLHQLLEAFMNGCSIVNVYEIRNISVEDYVYIAQAQQYLAPYDEFLLKAALNEKITSSNPAIACTARTAGKKTLLLLGNYGTRNPAKTTVNTGNAAVKDVISGKSLKVRNGVLSVELPPDDIRLLEVIHQ